MAILPMEVITFTITLMDKLWPSALWTFYPCAYRQYICFSIIEGRDGNKTLIDM